MRDAFVAVLMTCTLCLGCGFERQLTYTTTRSAIMEADLTYSVFLPPGFEPDEELPLVTFLPGGGDDPAVWDRYGLSERIGQAMANGDVPRAVIYFPQGDNGFWMNWYDGSRRYEDWIVDELLPEVAQRYHTKSCPEHCHIMGVSMGGHGALRFALNRGDRFSSVTALSAPIFDTAQMKDFVDNRLFSILIPTHRVFGPPGPPWRLAAEDVYQRWQRPSDTGGLKIFIGWAKQDRASIRTLSRRFSDHLEDHGIVHHSEEFDGSHNWVSWTPVIERALKAQLEPSANI